MIKVDGLNALASYAASLREKAEKQGASPFRVVLTEAEKSQEIQDPDEIAERAFTADLNTALQNFGISTPPSIRISREDDGYELQGDKRNANFQAMLNANPSLRDKINDMLQRASDSRKKDLSGVISDFLGKSSSIPGIGKFLTDFATSEKQKNFSLSFNGSNISVEESNGQQWVPVKGESSFTADIIAAYTKFQIEYGISVEKKKDEDLTDSDIEFKRQIAEAICGSRAISSLA